MKNTVENFRYELEHHREYSFYLVGSRLLGTARPDSDWDYVVTVKDGVVGALLGMGFANILGADVRVDENAVYGDNDKYVKAIVQRQCDDGLIQVAIVADASLKLRIMQVLSKHEILRNFDLSLHKTKARNQLWDALYALTGWKGSPAGTGGAPYEHREPKQKKPPMTQEERSSTGLRARLDDLLRF